VIAAFTRLSRGPHEQRVLVCHLRPRPRAGATAEAEEEAAYESTTHTAMEVPVDLVKVTE